MQWRPASVAVSISLAILVASAPFNAQQQLLPAAQDLSFEVVSIKVNPSTEGSIFTGCHQPNDPRIPAGRCVFRRASLMWILAEAYALRPFLASQWLAGVPTWATRERYDIEAKAENAEASPADLRLMVRNMLADRFKLAVHQITKEVSGYALLVAKGGPKVRKGNGTSRPGIGGNLAGIDATNVSMAGFASQLSGILGVPVVDMTELTGDYTFTLTFTRDPNDVSAPSIFTALQEQLGLKLESRRVPAQVLVIDHVEKPTEN